MENRFEHNPPEEQNWGAYATPPALPGQQQNQKTNDVPQRTTSVTLCARVREVIPPLLENDGTIRPEMATAVRAHLAGCPGCAREYKELQKVMRLVEKMPMADMPMDYSGLIMQRIQAQAQSPLWQNNAKPASNLSTQAVIKTTLTETQKRTQSLGAVQTVASRLALWQRVFLAGIFTALLSFFLSSAWGQRMLGVNVETASEWLSHTASAVRQVPLLGWVAGSAFAALSQASETLQETSRTMGATAAQGVAFDIALCAGVCFVMAAQRQRTRSTNGREN